jgi:hypothetical protein
MHSRLEFTTPRAWRQQCPAPSRRPRCLSPTLLWLRPWLYPKRRRIRNPQCPWLPQLSQRPCRQRLRWLPWPFQLHPRWFELQSLLQRWRFLLPSTMRRPQSPWRILHRTWSCQQHLPGSVKHKSAICQTMIKESGSSFLY